MTWSIVARDPETGYFGIAIATRFFAVGALCPWTEAKVGAPPVSSPGTSTSRSFEQQKHAEHTNLRCE